MLKLTTLSLRAVAATRLLRFTELASVSRLSRVIIF